MPPKIGFIPISSAKKLKSLAAVHVHPCTPRHLNILFGAELALHFRLKQSYRQNAGNADFDMDVKKSASAFRFFLQRIYCLERERRFPPALMYHYNHKFTFFL